MPRRRRYERDDDCECGGYGCEVCNPDSPETQESEDIRCASGIPTLLEIRQHIKAHAWNGGECIGSMTNEEVFSGQCEYASTAISEILTGTGHNGEPVDWSLRKRGWFKGDLSSIRNRSGCDPHAFASFHTEGVEDKHCHSWVEYRGKIYDATFWQFGDEGDEVRVYMFDVGDPRYEEDDNA